MEAPNLDDDIARIEAHVARLKAQNHDGPILAIYENLLSGLKEVKAAESEPDATNG